MTLADIGNIRLITQQISQSKFKTPEKIVKWMGAIQAQDYPMSKWALGVRLPGSTEAEIEKAIARGSIVRTHVLRPTWHLVSSDDIYWMLELTASHIKVLMRSQEKKLELTELIYTKCNNIIAKALQKNKCMTRKELMAELWKSKIDTSDIRGAFIMFRAEMEAIVCNGIPKDNIQTYSLLSERVRKRTRSLNREEASTKLAKIYFKSHGPATLKDFTWWSGLPAKDSKSALENIRSNLISKTIGQVEYWFTNSFLEFKQERNSVYFLPAYDEFIISYKSRDVVIPPENQGRAFTNNGLFKPVIVKDGKVIGLWKKVMNNGKVIIEKQFFKGYSKTPITLVNEAVEKYRKFLENR